MGRERIQEYTDLNVTTWSGNDDEAHEVRHEAGCQGVISVTANLIPGLFSDMMKEPNYETAEKCAGLIDCAFTLTISLLFL
jgi:4-hydroxy-tetrahydrodipicolinate synthase